MIDISGKEESERAARAYGKIKLGKDSLQAIREGKVKKGDALECARIAGTMAVKRIHELVPYCHQVPLDYIGFDFSINDESIDCKCEVKANYRTGVEMEAILGVEISLLTIWDMVKYMEKDENGQYPVACISEIRVIEKQKSKSKKEKKI